MKKFLTYFGRTLIKNAPAVEAGQDTPLWQGLIIFILSMFISIISIFTSTWTIDPSNSLNPNKAYLYGADQGLLAFNQHLVNSDLQYEVDTVNYKINNGQNKVTLEKWNASVGITDPQKYPAPYEYKQYISDATDASSITTKYVTVFKVYDFSSYTRSDVVKENVNRLLQGRSDELLADDVDSFETTTLKTDNIVYTPSLFIIASDAYAMYLFPYNSTKYSVVSGDYKSFNGLNSKSTLIENGKIDLANFNNMDKWVEFARKGGETSKNYTCLVQTGITASINIGITFLLGLLIFLFTRGKNNPYRVYKFHQLLNTAFWITFTPAVLAMGVGFMSSTFATMAYVMIFGVRSAFLSLRNFKPMVN